MLSGEPQGQAARISALSFTPGSGTSQALEFIAYYEYTGTAPDLTIRSGITFTKFVGDNGQDGIGTPGTAATQTAEGIVYYSMSKHLVQALTGATVTFVNPTGSLTLGTDIQSDNFVAGTSGWRIQRDTGDAEFGAATIRGTLTANQIQLGDGLLVGDNDALRLNDNYIRGIQDKTGRNFGDVMVTTESVSFPDVQQNILIDSLTITSSSNRSAVFTTQMSSVAGDPEYEVVVYGDINIGVGDSSFRSHSAILTSARGNIRVYGNINVQGRCTLTLNATNGCVQVFGTVTEATNATININTAAANICSANPVT